MRFRRCNRCGVEVGPRVDQCPECGGNIRVTLTEPGHGQIEYVIRRVTRAPRPIYSTSSYSRKRSR